MKKHLFIILIGFMSLSSGCLAQERNVTKELECIKRHTWTDGHEFVKYADKEFCENILNIKFPDHGSLVLWGGSLHEGGLILRLRYDSGQISVDNGSGAGWFANCDNVSVDTDRNLMFMHNAVDNNVHDILFTVSDMEDMKKRMCDDMLSYGLDGSYVDGAGNRYTFTSGSYKVRGLGSDDDIFHFQVLYDTPQFILVFRDKAYIVSKTRDGMQLIPVRINECEEEVQRLDEAPHNLKCIENPLACDYPLLSENYMTRSQLTYYAGSPYVYGERVTKERFSDFLETLGIMRNEIYARHGYVFKSEKWNAYYNQKQWYRPEKEDVYPDLSDIERTNIQIISSLETDYRNKLVNNELW